MAVAKDDESEHSQSVGELYELLLDALREIEHLDHVTIDSLIEASLTEFECFDRIQWAYCRRPYFYILFRASERYPEPIKFRGNTFPSNAGLVVRLAQDALGWLDDLVHFEFDENFDAVQGIRPPLPATKDEIAHLKENLSSERQWVEGLFHQITPIPDVNTNAPVSDDGPTPPYSWIHDGKRIESEMDKLAWRMVNYLWNCDGMIAKCEDLAEPVYDDREHDTGGYEITSLRTKANRFFKDQEIPLRVTIRHGEVRLLPRTIEKNSE